MGGSAEVKGERMTKVTFHRPSEVPNDSLKFAVIAARYQDKWVCCRHKERTTWEIPGGHREDGETIEETARRELYEETGAADAEIKCVASYGVEKDGEISFGMLFYADIHSLGTLPDSEIGEIKLFDVLPERLTYPEIQPELYHSVQAWLNIQSSADELWDVYDENRNPTGRLHRRGDFLGEGEYHLVVHVWLMNSAGEFLLTKRTPNKGFPNMWESTGGSAVAGDDSLAAALREVKEETGLTADPECGKCLFSLKRADNFLDVWLFKQDFDLDNVILQEGETCDKMYASADKIKEMEREGLFVPCSYMQKVFDMAKA